MSLLRQNNLTQSENQPVKVRSGGTLLLLNAPAGVMKWAECAGRAALSACHGAAKLLLTVIKQRMFTHLCKESRN